MYRCAKCGGVSVPREKINKVVTHKKWVKERGKMVLQIAKEEAWCINCLQQHAPIDPEIQEYQKGDIYAYSDV